MKNLTITEWLEQLPEPARTQALNNTEVCPYPGNENKELPSLFLAISMGFIWHQTPEGINYWSDIHDRAQKGEFHNI